MNYTLSINLEGFDKAEQILSKLSGGVKGIVKTPKISFSKWLDAGSEADGEKIGKRFGSGLISGWGKAILTGKNQLSKFWNDAVKFGNGGLQGIEGLSDAPKEIVNQRKPLTLSSIKSLMKFWDDGVKNAMPALPSIAQKLDWKKILTGLALGLSGDTFTGSRLLSDQLGKFTSGGEGGVANGIFGKGGIAGFSEIRLAFKIFKFAVESFRSIIEGALARATKIYSDALNNGLGLKFSANRAALANILGVSETDVFRFGAQMAYLNPKIKQATGILSQTSIPLTQLDWQFKILKLDLASLGSSISADLTPLILNLSKAFDNLAHNAAFLYNLIPKGTFSGSIKGLLTGVFGQGAMAGGGLLGKLFGTINASGKMPSPQAWMKQLPASHWEHMGLVTMGGTTNYQKEIAVNTKSMASDLKKVAKQLTGGNYTGNAWGMTPTTNNP